MKPWKVIDRAAAPDGGQMVLSQRDQEMVIHVDGEMLMSSRSHGSEAAMAAAAGLSPTRKRARVLVGGLGFGYTLAAVLARVGRDARVTVAEICDAVVEWNRGPAAALAGRPLDDPRVRVERADVMRLVRAAQQGQAGGVGGVGRMSAGYDAILLDVDNGPQALTTAGNRTIYGPQGLLALRGALTAGGILVVWSAAPDTRFLKRMRAAGFDARADSVAARTAGRGGQHTLFVGVVLTV